MSDSVARWRIVTAFATVYIVWGSTYLAIHYAIETIPPFMMAGARFLLAGGLLYGWARLRGASPPTGNHWWNAFVVGGLLLLGGNGGVVWAEQFIPSGLAALLVSTVPLWMVLIDWWFGSAERPRPLLLAGLVCGLGGVALLVGAPGLDYADPMQLAGGGAVLVASAFWALGSIRARQVELPDRPRMGTAIQMLMGGALLMTVGFLTGEPARMELDTISPHSVLALLYLVVFGSIVGFSAYIWLLRETSSEIVSTYAYVNPLVALILGWWFAGEPLASRTGIAAAVILASVALMISRKRPPRPPTAASWGGARPGKIRHS